MAVANALARVHPCTRARATLVDQPPATQCRTSMSWPRQRTTNTPKRVFRRPSSMETSAGRPCGIARLVQTGGPKNGAEKHGRKTRPKSFLLQLQAWPCRVREGLLLPEKSQPYGVKKMGQSGFLTAISCRLFSSVDVSPWRMGLFVARKEINEFQ